MDQSKVIGITVVVVSLLALLGVYNTGEPLATGKYSVQDIEFRERRAEEREIELEQLEQSLLDREDSTIAKHQAVEQREIDENTLELKEQETEETEFKEESKSHQILQELLQKHKGEDVRERKELDREEEIEKKETAISEKEKALAKRERAEMDKEDEELKKEHAEEVVEKQHLDHEKELDQQEDSEEAREEEWEKRADREIRRENKETKAKKTGATSTSTEQAVPLAVGVPDETALGGSTPEVTRPASTLPAITTSDGSDPTLED